MSHITVGDAAGGGHMRGSADPTKSKVPAGWQRTSRPRSSAAYDSSARISFVGWPYTRVLPARVIVAAAWPCRSNTHFV